MEVEGVVGRQTEGGCLDDAIDGVSQVARAHAEERELAGRRRRSRRYQLSEFAKTGSIDRASNGSLGKLLRRR